MPVVTPPIAFRLPASTQESGSQPHAMKRGIALLHCASKRTLLLLGDADACWEYVDLLAKPETHQRIGLDRERVDVWALKVPGLILSSSDFRGDWTLTLLDEFDRITSTSENPLIWIGDLEQFLSQCAQEVESYAWFKNILARGTLRLVARLAPTRIPAMTNRYPSLMRCFRTLEVRANDTAETKMAMSA